MMIDDVTYAYQLIGNGPTVVLLHGFTGTKQTWNSFVQSNQDNFQMLLIDLPGHGETKITKIRDMTECCHDIKAILDTLNLSNIHLIGYSMGGRTALSFAMLFPDYIQSLTLESASPGLRTSKDREQRHIQDEKLAKKLEHEGVKSFVDYWETIPLFQSQQNLALSTQATMRQERLSQSPKGLSSSLRGMGTGSQPSWWDQLSNIRHPLLLIVGALDQKFVMINKDIQSIVKHAQLEIIQDAGHTVHIEQPQVFNNCVQTFIDASIMCEDFKEEKNDR